MIQDILQTESDITPQRLLEAVEPAIALYYNALKSKYGDNLSALLDAMARVKQADDSDTFESHKIRIDAIAEKEQITSEYEYIVWRDEREEWRDEEDGSGRSGRHLGELPQGIALAGVRDLLEPSTEPPPSEPLPSP